MLDLEDTEDGEGPHHLKDKAEDVHTERRAQDEAWGTLHPDKYRPSDEGQAQEKHYKEKGRN